MSNGAENKDDDTALAIVETDSPLRQRGGWLAALRGGGRAGVEKLLRSVSGVDLFWEVIAEATRKAQEHDVQEFFELVANASAKEDIVGLLVDVAEGLDKPHVYRAVANGYTKMRECIDETAKPCLAVLVAQEMHDSVLPTAYFRQCAGLLADSDRAALSTLKLIVDLYVDSLRLHGVDLKWRMLTACNQVLDGHPGKTFWLTLRGDGEEKHSEILDQPENWKATASKLASYGFGRKIEGLTSAVPRPDAMGGLFIDWTAQGDAWMQGLHHCLQALAPT